MTKRATEKLPADSAVRCPNCSAPSPQGELPCRVCGYRPELAREFFWLYLGGAAFLLPGIAVGIAGVLLDEVGPEHWSRSFQWFPFWPCPEKYHWLGLVVMGITLSLGGMGLTRHFRSAWWTLAALLTYEIGLTIAATTGALGRDVRGGPFLLAVSLAFAALLMRVGVAMTRTPPRNVARLQKEAWAAEKLARGSESSSRDKGSGA